MVHILLLIIYISFISLGLPDGLLGAAWPAVHIELGVNVSMLGAVALIISGGTVVASLFSDAMARRFGTGKVTAFSVAMTAVSLFGFAFADRYWMLCLWAIPYGLGAGAVDSCLNNYVALHYSGKHMSWLHCMWGIGAAAGPYIMGFIMGIGQHWGRGYLYIGILQAVLSAFLLFSLPIWKGTHTAEQTEESSAPLSLGQIFRLPGTKSVFLAFFCYCALEQTLGQWAASYFYDIFRLPQETAAAMAGLYYFGITLGRAISGFLTVRFSDKGLTRFGMGGMALGIVCMLLPLGVYGTAFGVLLAGLGSAPVYPCIIHATPTLFGAKNSQAIIGVEMAFAYMGICLMPPVFGLISDWIGMGCLPVVLFIILGIMYLCHERLYASKQSQ